MLRPYLDFERVLVDGVFAAATQLYGITFARRDDLRGYTDECRTYEVHDVDGRPMALVVIDPYARPTKQGGAWMTSLVDQSHLLDQLPGGDEQLQPRTARARQADAHELGQRHHAVPRVRARHPRAAVGRALPVPLRDGDAPRLRRVPQPGQRDVGLGPGAARGVRASPRDRRARAPGVDRHAAGSASRRRGLRGDRGVLGDDPRPGLAPDPVRRAPRDARRGRGLRAEGAREPWCRVPARAAALPDGVLLAHLERQLCGRLLLVPLERGDGRRHRRVVRGERRPDEGERRPLPADAAEPWQLDRRHGVVPAVPR